MTNRRTISQGKVRARLNGPETALIVTRDHLDALSWVLGHIGAGPLYDLRMVVDQAREAQDGEG